MLVGTPSGYTSTSDWPAGLPDPLSASYQETRQPAVIRSEMDAGRPKQRKRFTAAVQQLKFAFSMTASQVAIFDDFFVTTLGEGSGEFNWTHPRTNAAIVARFAAPPEYQRESNRWRVICNFEILP